LAVPTNPAGAAATGVIDGSMPVSGELRLRSWLTPFLIAPDDIAIPDGRHRRGRGRRHQCNQFFAQAE
jgi:hypothetical protein